MIPVILKGETSKPIQLTLREGYVYSGCVLAVCFRGVMKTFTDLVAGGTVELLYTAEETSTFPLGTGKVGLSIQNSAGDICFMPWAKIKVTDSPAEVHDAQITIDPATLNVSDATSKDSLGAVKSKLNAVLAFLRGLSSLAVLALPLYALSDVAPLTVPLDDIPGDTPLMTNVVSYVDAKVAAVPEPDYSTGNTQLVATIEAKAPAPGDYETVSNKAMTAIQEHQTLWPAVEASTNYTDAALGAFVATGAVARATVYGTPTRWTDATGCVWLVEQVLGQWTRTQGPSDIYVIWHDGDDSPPYTSEGSGWYFQGDFQWPQIVSKDASATMLSDTLDNDLYYGPGIVASFVRGFVDVTNLVGRVALTNDIPDVSGYATQQQATNAAIAVAARKQDALPYPTNAIPYATIADTPTPPSVFYDSAGGAATVSGATLTYQAASNSVGSVSLLSGTNFLHITAPAAIPGRVRDFGVTVTTEEAATITLDSSVSWHFDAAATNLAAGSWNRVYCTESPAGVFSLQLWTPDSTQEATP